MKKFFIICIIIMLVCVAALIIYILSGHDDSLTLREYRFKTDKLTGGVKIAFVSDLHGTEFGEYNSRLVEMIKQSEPDLVFLGGDIFDRKDHIEQGKSLISQLTPFYPVYGVMGNHEYYTSGYDPVEIKRIYRELGVTLLENGHTTLELDGGNINICGADPFVGDAHWQENTVEGADRDNYTVVINHRPDQWTEFTDKDVDLMLSGHAHGGQWRVPGLINGVLAPNQGFFPKYAGGLYEFEDGMNLVVSRGLALSRVPRVYNPPELVVIKIESDR